jgi:hypothetical protein
MNGFNVERGINYSQMALKGTFRRVHNKFHSNIVRGDQRKDGEWHQLELGELLDNSINDLTINQPKKELKKQTSVGIEGRRALTCKE